MLKILEKSQFSPLFRQKSLDIQYELDVESAFIKSKSAVSTYKFIRLWRKKKCGERACLYFLPSFHHKRQKRLFFEEGKR